MLNPCSFYNQLGVKAWLIRVNVRSALGAYTVLFHNLLELLASLNLLEFRESLLTCFLEYSIITDIKTNKFENV